MIMSLKNRCKHELPKWARLLGITRTVNNAIEFTWGYISIGPSFEIILHRGTYFDQRFAISLGLIFGRILVYLPFKTSLEEGCDMPQYGVCIHSNSLWVYKGGKYENGQTQNGWITWDIPFFSWDFIGRWIKDKNGEYVLIEKESMLAGSSYLSIHDFKEHHALKESHPYVYNLKSGEVQRRIATCTVEKLKWNRKWFPMFSKTSERIDVWFDEETGERTGSWKGGVLGCSYQMEKDETIKQCLSRMERERKFD